jgi:hypothetical protein
LSVARSLERRIIGESSALSCEVSFRLRTFGWFRYVTSAIALKTLAHGTVRVRL